MKTINLALLILSAHLSFGQSTNPYPYCAHEYDDGAAPNPHYISRVTIGNFTNISGYTQQAFPHYVFYNNLTPGPFPPNSNQYLNIRFDAGGDKDLLLWTDWNTNGIFEITEWLSLSINPGDTSYSGIINIPNFGFGIRRMRIILAEDTSQWIGSCGTTYDWGETEDYDILIGYPSGVSFYSNENITIYPNPSNGQLKITIGKNIEMISIYTSSLQLVYERSYVNEQELNLNLSVEPGLYILAIKTEEGWARKKVLIE